MKKNLTIILLILLSFAGIYANNDLDMPVHHKMCVVGGGIIGALESYYEFQESQKNGQKVCITVYEKGDSFDQNSGGGSSTNTAYNIVPSLTPDEILCVVPYGSELMEKLAVLFDQPGGIRIDDVAGVNDSVAAMNFKKAVAAYASDKNHTDRLKSLLMLGKKSMDLWQQMYDEGDSELKIILETSNFHPCHETKNDPKALHDGYRIDLIYGIQNAENRALAMKADYEKLGYKNCAVLSPDEVIAIDPFLNDFCLAHTNLDANKNRIWKNDSVALWRPGGCIDMTTFLPKFYAYLKKTMGQYKDSNNHVHDCFQLQFGHEVTEVVFDVNSNDLHVIGLKFSNGTQHVENPSSIECHYVFCPGEAVGTLYKFGFNEPTYTGFAGASMMITIPLKGDQVKKYKSFSHCMEVHNVGIVLAWQARFKENSIFIRVAGTKAFYGDKQPNKNEDFSKNRNLVQLNMINNVLPEFITIACGYDTKGKNLTAKDLIALENKGIARRWVGRRAVAYDGFPTLGSLYSHNRKVVNARCTTHLGSGGVSFGPGAVFASRSSEKNTNDALVQKLLGYADSRRASE